MTTAAAQVRSKTRQLELSKNTWEETVFLERRDAIVRAERNEQESICNDAQLDAQHLLVVGNVAKPSLRAST
eukprot:3601614-Pleurochrysis_carterae.AAC.2